MGICSSCLGRQKEPETSRLLSDDPYRSSYGSRAQTTRRPADEADIEHTRREREILESIAHGMSEEVVDIFTILPENQENINQDRSSSSPPQTNGFKEEDARAQKMAYGTVNKAHINRISAPMSSLKHDWDDVKANMG
ncbi:MAG: hypothetical protein Q9170_004494 [Blastenia crenularia]